MDLIRNDVTKMKWALYSKGTCIKFVWAPMGRKILNDHMSAKKEDIEL